jgi:hypothetical protein
MHILHVVGARPNFMKAAPVLAAPARLDARLRRPQLDRGGGRGTDGRSHLRCNIRRGYNTCAMLLMWHAGW